MSSTDQVDHFKHWLNGYRTHPVSYVFHEIVARFREAASLAAPAPVHTLHELYAIAAELAPNAATYPLAARLNAATLQLAAPAPQPDTADAYLVTWPQDGQTWESAHASYSGAEAEAARHKGAVIKDLFLSPSAAYGAAARDVLAERARQVSAEGWTPKHDDEHTPGQLALAASCYAAHSSTVVNGVPSLYEEYPPPNWPWHSDWWKPGDPRRMLVKAGALILAEIERLDRAAGIPSVSVSPSNPALLTMAGEVVSIGDLPADEVPPLAGVPHLLLRLADGRQILVSGLTRDECRACAPAFMSPAAISISSAPEGKQP